MAKIFVSYASEDRDFVHGLAAALTAAGHAVWFDRDLMAGLFREQITAQLAAADAVIVVWSARSKASRYVLDESERAVSRRVLLPVRIDASELPLGFGGVQTFDLSRWPGHPDDDRMARANRDAMEQQAPGLFEHPGREIFRAGGRTGKQQDEICGSQRVFQGFLD